MKERRGMPKKEAPGKAPTLQKKRNLMGKEEDLTGKEEESSMKTLGTGTCVALVSQELSCPLATFLYQFCRVV